MLLAPRWRNLVSARVAGEGGYDGPSRRRARRHDTTRDDTRQVEWRLDETAVTASRWRLVSTYPADMGQCSDSGESNIPRKCYVTEPHR